ncbi:MAG TPA: tripartite tricarboxylate transporter substrate binding protein [Ramlibacter sp.]|nr:tripartite tricarboxylate transporter substrate binding protein [Ramlibacter sp.]
MTMPTPARRRALLAAATALAAAGLVPLSASAQAGWPNRPIKLIVPFAPGGGSDIIARTIATKLSARLGQPIIIDNRGGGGGILGVDAAAKAAPDGYTLLFTTTAFATNAAASRKLPYDSAKDFTPIGQIGATPLLVVVAGDSRIRTLRDLIEAAKAKPGAVNYGSGGMSSMSHLGMEYLATAAKIKITHVPYKGMAPAFTDVMAGNIQVGMSTFASAAGMMEAGKLRGLAVTSAQRLPFAPNLPTVAESGVPGFQVDFWWGLMAPARVPAEVVKRVNEELNAVLAQPEAREILARDAAVPTPSTPEGFSRLVAQDLARWSKLVKDANIQVE